MLLNPLTANLPLLITAEQGKESISHLQDWLTNCQDDFKTHLNQYGAILFRGFSVEAEQFELVAQTGTPNLKRYTGGGSPRTHLGGNIYTSTEYAPDQHIPLHCEATYLPTPPDYIWFYSQLAARVGGETPIGDMRQVLAELPVEIIQQFREKGVMYIYNLHNGNGFGRGWREAFDTDDKSTVETWLTKNGALFEWMPDNSLSVRLSAAGVSKLTGSEDEVWSNQAVNWHVSVHGARMANAMRRLYKDVYLLPKHALFGDGSEIPEAFIEKILTTLKSNETIFPWLPGDLLVCDNRFIAHGRNPFQGNRKVLVAMS